MSRLGRASVLLVLLAALPLGPLAGQEAPGLQGARIGVIDVQRLVVDSQSGRSVLEELRNLSEQKNAEGEALQQEVRLLQSRLQDGRQSLSEERILELEKELEDKLIELRRFADDAERALEKEQTEAFATIEREVMPIITRIGEEQGFTLLFNKFESGLVFAAEEVDITDLVLRLYDESVQEED